VAVPFATPRQSAAVQHLPAGMQACSHRLNPGEQVKSQLVPLQVATPLSGIAQGAQLTPHEFTLTLLRHWPAQSCVPMAQLFMQGEVMGIQLPAQSACPTGHAAPQLWPSQVAVPPVGAVQAVQEVPQLAGNVLSTHLPPQR
jgi:hypothetical protein